MSIYFIYFLFLGGGLAIGYFVKNALTQRNIKEAESKAQVILDKAKTELANAQKQAKEIVLSAKSEAIQLQERIKKEEEKRRAELSELEKRLFAKDESLDKRLDSVTKKQEELASKDKELVELKDKIEEIKAKQEEKLASVAKMTKEEAREVFLKKIEKEAREDALKLSREIEAKAKEEADTKAAEIISEAIQRYASEVSTEHTTFTVALPNDDMKGRVIGKEGRNIQAFEKASGVDLIVDDTPEAVVISSFDPVRRHIAKRALEKLVKDGRIHPARIETMVKKAQEEVEKEMKKLGEDAVLELGLTGLHPDLVKLVGRLHFRTSYGQNILKHSVETAHLASLMATQLGVDPKLAKLAALMHDIGKALDHEYEGGHVELSRDIAVKYGLPQPVIHAVEVSHEGSGGPKSALDFIVMAADAISASRPGARRENMEQFIKRLKDIENIAGSFEGVEKAYAIQAGREVRVMVVPTEVDDLGTMQIAKKIAKKIENELTYPGTVKVTAVRELRAEETAK